MLHINLITELGTNSESRPCTPGFWGGLQTSACLPFLPPSSSLYPSIPIPLPFSPSLRFCLSRASLRSCIRVVLPLYSSHAPFLPCSPLISLFLLALELSRSRSRATCCSLRVAPPSSRFLALDTSRSLALASSLSLSLLLLLSRNLAVAVALF